MVKPTVHTFLSNDPLIEQDSSFRTKCIEVILYSSYFNVKWLWLLSPCNRRLGGGSTIRDSFPACAFFLLKWRLTRAHLLHSSGQDQSTVVQREETIVAECSLTSCV